MLRGETLRSETLRGMPRIEVMRRLLPALWRLICGLELRRAARTAEARLRDVILGRPLATGLRPATTGLTAVARFVASLIYHVGPRALAAPIG